MSWNPVLDKFVEIKKEYIKYFGNITYDYVSGYTNETQTCLERWVQELNNLDLQYKEYKYAEYEDLLSCLELNQHGHLLLFRYARYSNVYDGETENSGEDFWDRYNGFYRECRKVTNSMFPGADRTRERFYGQRSLIIRGREKERDTMVWDVL